MSVAANSGHPPSLRATRSWLAAISARSHRAQTTDAVNSVAVLDQQHVGHFEMHDALVRAVKPMDAPKLASAFNSEFQ